MPLWTWLATVVMFTVVGPGDDIVFGGTGIMAVGPVLLIALGALPGAWLVMRHPGSAGVPDERRSGANSGARAR